MIKIKPSHRGLLHKNLGVKQGHKISEGSIRKAEHSSSAAVRKRAVFAENARHWNHHSAGGSVGKFSNY